MNSISNNPLSKEEQEEEEMRNELKDAGLLEENMNKAEMEDIIKVLNESKKDAPVSSDQFELKPNTPLRSEEKSLPSFHYPKQPVNSDSASSKSFTFKDQNKEKSPDPAINKSFEKNLNEKNHSEEESIYEPTYSLKDEFPPLGNSSNSNIGEPRTLRNRKPSAAMIKRAAQERWKLNPLKFENREIPPLIPEPPQIKPFHQVEDLNSKLFDEAFEEMKLELDRIHEIFMDYSNEGNKLGSPIKMGKCKIKSTADATSFMEKLPSSSSYDSDALVRSTPDRATKRKAVSTMAAISPNDSSNENSEEEFLPHTRKRRIPMAKKTEPAAKKVQENQKSKSSIHPNENTEMIDDEVKDIEMFDNSVIHNIRKSSKLFNTGIVDQDNTSEYPRRVVPTNPVKKTNNKGPRAKKKSSTESQNIKEQVQDEYIAKVLDNLSQEIDNDDCVVTQEIKPRSVGQSARKLQLGTERLEKAEEERKRKIKAEEERKKKKEIEEQIKNDELISSRYQDKEDKLTRDREKEEKFKKQENVYNGILNTRAKKNRELSYKAMNQIPLANGNVMLNGQDVDIEITHSNLPEKNMCPICQKSFTSQEIENHASECNEFPCSEEINKANYSRSSSSQLTCHICNVYQTNDGHSYEDHVTKCTERARDRKIGIHA